MTVTQGWDYEPENKAGGKAGFVTIPHKGSFVKVRIVAAPVHFKKKTNFNNEEKIVPRHLCLVIERNPDGDEAKVFEIGDQIYIEIKKYLNDPDWGDITKYDFKVTRNKEKTTDPGSEPFYSVQPSPRKTEITEEELKLLADAGIDLIRLGEAFSFDKVAKSSKSVAAAIDPAKPAASDDNDDLPF